MDPRPGQGHPNPIEQSLRRAIVEEARSYIGTPFHHQGRVKGVGIDCVGLLILVGRSLKVYDGHDIEAYPRCPDGVTLMRELDKCVVRVPSTSCHCLTGCWHHGEECPLMPGDLLAFWIRHHTRPKHAAIIGNSPTGPTMIHTYADVGRVVETNIDERWHNRIAQVFRYPGLI